MTSTARAQRVDDDPEAGRSAVDWSLAASTAARVAGSGPQIPLATAREAVADLRACAADAVGFVAEHTGLDAPVEPGRVAVVDRPGWIEANLVGFRQVLDPVVARMRADRPAALTTGPVGAVGSRVAGIEVGAALGFLGGKVLGQYELFTAGGDAPPRLLLVAPNIVEVERALGVVPHDFRLWVALHEETHRVQFTAVPWLGPWLRGQIGEYLDTVDLDVAALAKRVRQAGGVVVGAFRGIDAMAALEQLMSPEERVILDRLTAVMSLLEGHADVVMDGVGPDVVPTVHTIRSRFQQRRQNVPAGEAFVRRLLGVESKMRQYRDGATFVRHVVDEVGMAGFNRVWDSPDSLPSREELHDPAAWLRRTGPGPAS